MGLNLNLSDSHILIIKSILVLLIVAVLSFIGYLIWVSIPEQESIINQSEINIERMK